MVKEVMRSCGGSVQGIREVKATTTIMMDGKSEYDDADDQVGLYLNRADDGFVYFDNGSYSHGPTDTLLSSSKGGVRMTTSVALDDNCRCLFTTSFALDRDDEGFLEVDDNAFHSEQHLFVRKVPEQCEDEVSVANIGRVDFGLSSEFDNSWEHQCRMSTTSQPWNIQRAVWEQMSSSTKEEEDLDGTSNASWSSSAFRPLASVGRHGKDEFLFKSGLANLKTGEVRSICRYNPETGKLKRVALQHGKLDPSQQHEQN